MNPRAQKHERLKAIGFVVRLALVAIVIGSLLSVLTPLGAASATHLCTMECCVGKAPHLAGACSAGILNSARRTPAPTEEFCGVRNVLAIVRVKIQPINLNPVSDEAATESCGMHTESGAGALPTREQSSNALGPFVSSFSTPCSMDCGACSVSNTVNPRPREQSFVAWAGQARPPTSFRSLGGPVSSAATSRGHYEQPRPRGPPTSLS